MDSLTPKTCMWTAFSHKGGLTWRTANGCQVRYHASQNNRSDRRHRQSHRRGGPAAAATATATAAAVTAATATSANGAADEASRTANTAADPTATAAGRKAASATATYNHSYGNCDSEYNSISTEQSASERIVASAPATRIAAAEGTPGKGNCRRSTQEKKPRYLLSASVVLSEAGPSRRSGGREPQAGGISRCRQRPPGPIASSTAGFHPLARYTSRLHAAARVTPPRATQLSQRELSRAVPQYSLSGCSLGQGGQQAAKRPAKPRQCGGQGK